MPSVVKSLKSEFSLILKSTLALLESAEKTYREKSGRKSKTMSKINLVRNF